MENYQVAKLQDSELGLISGNGHGGLGRAMFWGGASVAVLAVPAAIGCGIADGVYRVRSSRALKQGNVDEALNLNKKADKLAIAAAGCAAAVTVGTGFAIAGAKSLHALRRVDYGDVVFSPLLLVC